MASVFGDAAAGTGPSARVARAVHDRQVEQEQREHEVPDVVVLASGNLANIYVADSKHRLDRGELELQLPGLVDALALHPGVGFVMVRTGPGDDDAVVLGADGSVDVATGAVNGVDPLAVYGPNALRHLRRTNGFEHVGDLLVMGTYDPRLDEITAFEQLCGSHGGLGGGQTRPFAVFPSGWYEPAEKVVGAGEMHKVLKRWLHDAGQDVVLPPGMDALPADARTTAGRTRLTSTTRP